MEDLYIHKHIPGQRQSTCFVTDSWITFGSEVVTSLGAETRHAAAPVCVSINATYDVNMWQKRLDQLSRLEHGWNGYDAPPPSGAAIITAKGFLTHLLSDKSEPSRLAPSSVGGVGITHKRRSRRVYVEFFNDGDVCALFSDNESPPRSKRVSAGYDEFRLLVSEIKDYLNA